MKYIEESGRNDIIYRDIHEEIGYREKLISAGGKEQVPCLFIDGEPLYESLDIIAWLQEHPQESPGDFSINEMLAMQRALQEQYKDKWEHISPETGKNKLLWMIGEIGEVIDIVKKYGPEAVCSEREQLVEELVDVLMYYNDVLLCYGITAEELKKTYTDKFKKNMERW